MKTEAKNQKTGGALKSALQSALQEEHRGTLPGTLSLLNTGEGQQTTEDSKAESNAEKSKAEKLAENTAKYAAIVKEAYADYRRTRSRFPELADDLATGTAEALYQDSDRAFRLAMEEEARKLGLNLKKLKQQIENLRTGEAAYPGSPDADPYEPLKQLFL